MSSAPVSSPVLSPGPSPSRPSNLRRFLRGPKLADRKGFAFLVTIFLLIGVVFGVAFYAFLTTLQPMPLAPIQFGPASMAVGNATFNVTGDSNGSWTWTNFTVNLTINNFGGVAVPLPPSGRNATFLIGSTTHKDLYQVVWLDLDHDGKVNRGDAFRVTGDGAPLPALSYCKFSLAWSGGTWTATEYWVTSSAIV